MQEQGSQPQGQRPASPTAQVQKEHRRTQVRLAIGLALLILFIIFVIQNSGPVKVNFVFVTSRIRLIWVFVVCALIGGLIVWLVGRPRRRAMKRLIEELEKGRTS